MTLREKHMFASQGLPLLLLGVALLQAVIALSGLRTVTILTWSSSSFDSTAVMMKVQRSRQRHSCPHGILIPVSGK
ncbi:hypothetical protein EDB19DRAFT_1761775 [Suillus lakei]|nr:hypothetical protein EDB19DRAFT_1761775 [Suillus lakei]